MSCLVDDDDDLPATSSENATEVVTNARPTREIVLNLLRRAVALDDRTADQLAFGGLIRRWRFTDKQMALLKFILDLVERNTTTTFRGAYYELGLLYPALRISTNVVLTSFYRICFLLGLEARYLPLTTAPRGWVLGNFKLRMADNEEIIFSTNKRRPIPTAITDDLKSAGEAVFTSTHVRSTSASQPFILWVEDYDTFRKLTPSFLERYPGSILMTAEGIPSFASRCLCKYASEGLKLPVFILVDGDPYGMSRIALVVKYGSKTNDATAAAGDLSVLSAKWLGIRSEDIVRPSVFKALTASSERVIEEALEKAKQHSEKAMVAELRLMQKSQRTFPLQALMLEELLAIIDRAVAVEALRKQSKPPAVFSSSILEEPHLTAVIHPVGSEGQVIVQKARPSASSPFATDKSAVRKRKQEPDDEDVICERIVVTIKHSVQTSDKDDPRRSSDFKRRRFRHGEEHGSPTDEEAKKAAYIGDLEVKIPEKRTDANHQDHPVDVITIDDSDDDP